MGPASSSAANDPHQSAVTEPSVTRAKVPAAAAGARRSSIKGMKSELASPRAGDRRTVPVLGVAQGQPQPGHAEPAGLKELGAAKLLCETCSSQDSRDSGPGCSPVPEGGRLHDPHAEQAPKEGGGMGQKGLQSRAGLTAVLLPLPSLACDSAPRQPGCAQTRRWQKNNFSGHTTYKMLQEGNGMGYRYHGAVELRGSPNGAGKAAGLGQPCASPCRKTHSQGHILPCPPHHLHGRDISGSRNRHIQGTRGATQEVPQQSSSSSWLQAACPVRELVLCIPITQMPSIPSPVRHRDKARTCLSQSPARSQAAQGYSPSQGG